MMNEEQLEEVERAYRSGRFPRGILAMTLSPNGYLQFRCEVREADQELLKAYCAIAEALRNSRYVERVDVEDGGDDA